MMELQINVGQTVRFDPFACLTAQEDIKKKNTITGKVVMVNARNQWFLVEYQLGGVFRTSFKFSQIGTAVKICK